MQTKAAIALASLLLFTASSVWAQESYSVRMDPGVTPRMSASQVAALALSVQETASASAGARRSSQGEEASANAPTVKSVECLDGAELRKAMARGDSGEPLWVVRMTGRFVNLRTPPGVEPQVRRSGFYVIDDTTGEVIAFGGTASEDEGGESTPIVDRFIRGR